MQTTRPWHKRTEINQSRCFERCKTNRHVTAINSLKMTTQPERQCLSRGLNQNSQPQRRYITVLYVTLLYCTLHYSSVRYITVLYGTLLYCTLHYCTVRYITVLYVTTTQFIVTFLTSDNEVQTRAIKAVTESPSDIHTGCFF